jgi:outer membrane murein-binding lipoprotein Lpp
VRSGSLELHLVVACILGSTLAGCASAVGWGKKYEIVQKNSKSITVKYDSLLADFKTFAQEVE